MICIAFIYPQSPYLGFKRVLVPTKCRSCVDVIGMEQTLLKIKIKQFFWVYFKSRSKIRLNKACVKTPLSGPLGSRHFVFSIEVNFVVIRFCTKPIDRCAFTKFPGCVEVPNGQATVTRFLSHSEKRVVVSALCPGNQLMVSKSPVRNLHVTLFH